MIKKCFCKTVLFSFLLVFAVLNYGYAGPLVEEWSADPPYDSEYSDWSSGLTTDAGGNVYVTGNSFNGSNYDLFTVKYDASGTEVWRRTYSTTLDDFGNNITVDTGGNAYVAGDSCGSSSPPCGGFILKYDPSGTLLSPWNPKTLSGTGRCSDVKVDASGNVYATGPYRTSPQTEPDFRLLKLNQFGSSLWSKTYNRGDFDYASALALDASGNYIYVTGDSYNGTDYDYLTVKFSSSSSPSTPLWVRVYNSGGNEFPYDIAVYGNDQIYVTGDTVTIKYSSSGNVLATAPLRGTGIAVDGSGYVYVAGYVSEMGSYGITKTSSLLTELWTQLLNISAFDVTVDVNADLYITGTTYSGPNPGNVFTSKYQQVPLSIVTDLLEDGTVGTAYSLRLTADGGAPDYTWSVVSGYLPDGLTLNSTTGEISGTPAVTGEFHFTVQARDNASATAEKALLITIYNPLGIVTPSPLADGMAGRSYTLTLTVSGGQPGYIWAVSSGSLPNGLSLSASGMISGTATTAGISNFSVRATDTRARTTTKDYSITVHESLQITTPSLSSGMVGTPYVPTTLNAGGGETPYVWSGDMPHGLIISSANGEITGTPTTPGTHTVTVQLRDANSFTTSREYTVQFGGIACSAPVRIEEAPYDNIETAYTAALDGQTIRIAALELTENLEFNSALSLGLTGGYDSEFAGNPWNTSVKGMITISAGTVAIENIVLR